MKVLHIITDLEVGGAEMMLYRLLAGRQRADLQPLVLSLMPQAVVGARLESLGIPIFTLDMPRRAPSPLTLSRLGRLARRLAPDLFQGWMYHGNLAATVASRLAGGSRPVIWNVRHSLHELGHEKLLTRVIIRASMLLSGTARAIIYNSRVSAEQHERLGFAADRTVVIPNGFDCQRFRPCPEARPALCRRLGIPEDRIIVGMVARGHAMKDPATLIRAAGLLANEGWNLHLVVIGEFLDPGNHALAQDIRTAGLDGRVSPLGERHDIPELMPGFDVAALSSAWGEGFPNVLGEALASGVPCVATDVGDCAAIIGDAGRVAPPRDPAALAAALRALLELGPDGRRRLGALGRARVVEQFSIEEVVRQYEALYERVGEDPAPGAAGRLPVRGARTG